MGIKLVVAITDGDWFRSLRNKPNLDEVNFWAPSGKNFRALVPGELFLFKLHAPRNFIVGGGIFAHASPMPCSLAWEAFGPANGAESLVEMKSRIAKYRSVENTPREDFIIGCRILTQPTFFHESDWMPVPDSWPPNTQRYKGFTTDEPDGLGLWEGFSERISHSAPSGFSEGERFGKPMLVRPRLGQGAFRMLVTDAYGRKCAVTREKVLPALEAAHIQPFAEGGAHEASNGLLLRRDIHSLFDVGYVTVTPQMHLEVSRSIKEDFDNGQEYYRLHGRSVMIPKAISDRPDPSKLQWHNECRFRG